jgi:hypothetical protein
MRCTLVLAVLGAAAVAPVHADYYDCEDVLGSGTCMPCRAGVGCTYSTLDDCQAACGETPGETYWCGAGLWPGTHSCQLVHAGTVPSGQFLSLAACQASCSSGGQANVTFTKGTWMDDPSCNPSAPGCSDGQATPQGGCREPTKESDHESLALGSCVPILHDDVRAWARLGCSDSALWLEDGAYTTPDCSGESKMLCEILATSSLVGQFQPLLDLGVTIQINWTNTLATTTCEPPLRYSCAGNACPDVSTLRGIAVYEKFTSFSCPNPMQRPSAIPPPGP